MLKRFLRSVTGFFLLLSALNSDNGTIRIFVVTWRFDEVEGPRRRHWVRREREDEVYNKEEEAGEEEEWRWTLEDEEGGGDGFFAKRQKFILL